MRRLFAALLSVCLADAAHAATEVRRAETPIRVDAQLDEAAWTDATPIEIAYEWFPGDNVAAPVKTEALVTWDDDRLYVAFRAHDPQPSRIRARYAERDAAGSDDLVGFFIDPFNDDKRAYQFVVNPLGVQRDAINSDVEGTEDFSWDAVWDSAGRLTADGFVVEIAIPLQQLRIPTGSTPQTWGFMAVREWPRDVAHRLRSVVTNQDRNCLICQFADVTGFRAARAGRNLEVTPTLTGTVRQERELGRFRTADDGLEPGVSARWAMTPGTSLQATLNPDFSQVEADAAALDVNTRFALSFPEKRPFFVEGSDFFETQLPLLFTRTIADPAAGLKLTGKSGAHAYGLLVARDEVTNFLLPGAESSRRTSLARSSSTAVGRYRRELGANGSVGGFFSSRSGDGYSNHVLSADSYWRVTEQDSLRVQLAGSRGEYPAGLPNANRSLSGHAARLDYEHNDRNWSLDAEYIELAPEFRADAGLFNQVGVRAMELGASRRIRGGADRWFRNIYLEAGLDGTREFHGAWNEWGADLGATWQGPRQTTIEVNLAPNQEYFAGRTYHNFRQSAGASTQLSRDVAVGLNVNWGEQIDFTNRRPARFVTIAPAADFNIGRRIRGEVSYARQTFETEQGSRIFTVDLPQARLLYHFSRRAFVRTIVQYQSVDFGSSRERELLTQMLFSYRVNAQTVFLAGYSDDYLGDRDLTQTDRTVFMKVAYAWLF